MCTLSGGEGKKCATRCPVCRLCLPARRNPHNPAFALSFYDR
nr:MAG TPA: Radical SAM superfamily [Caudoviricetes sp.]